LEEKVILNMDNILLRNNTIWIRVQKPEEEGFCSKKLEIARKYFEEIGSDAVMVIYRGKVLVEWGNIAEKYKCHSLRKSFLNALYGIHVNEDRIELNKTLYELGIDDIPELTIEEKMANVRDLLMARSGVYHAAASETDDMRSLRPLRGYHKTGAYWYYNNWDFNVLGTIFNKVTKLDMFEEFKSKIAEPLGMEDFQIEDTFYHMEKEYSIHPSYHFKMSTRDKARFGLLFLQNGRWNDKQIISESWIKESTSSYSENDYGGYGYLWWINNSESYKSLGMYSAIGVGGNAIHILPRENMVYVHSTDTYNKKYIDDEKQMTLLKMILASRI
jgi:CubicO group peptidase (beta-lactamase class C family)